MRNHCNHCSPLHCICNGNCNAFSYSESSPIATIAAFSQDDDENTAMVLAQIEATPYRDLIYSRNQAIIALWLFEKLLPRTIATLSLADLNIPTKTLRVKGLGKFISLHKSTVHYLDAYLQDRDFLTPTHNRIFVSRFTGGQPMSTVGIQTILKNFGYTPKQHHG